MQGPKPVAGSSMAAAVSVHRAEKELGSSAPIPVVSCGARRPTPASVRCRFSANQPPIAINVAPAQRAEFAEPQTGADRDVEETDVKEIGFASAWIVGRELDERAPDRIRVRHGDLLADEVLSGRKVGPRGGISENQAVSDSVRQHLAQRDDHVPHRARCPASASRSAMRRVDILAAERGKNALSSSRGITCLRRLRR